jgi:hypothetical protein
VKTSARKLQAIRRWQASNKHRVKLANDRYEKKNRAERNAQRAAYARMKATPGGAERRLEGLKHLREKNKRKLEAF